jgi:hypothetical protein
MTSSEQKLSHFTQVRGPGVFREKSLKRGSAKLGVTPTLSSLRDSFLMHSPENRGEVLGPAISSQYKMYALRCGLFIRTTPLTRWSQLRVTLNPTRWVIDPQP